MRYIKKINGQNVLKLRPSPTFGDDCYNSPDNGWSMYHGTDGTYELTGEIIDHFAHLESIYCQDDNEV